MIEEGDYCIDILTQIKAIKNSIVSVEGKILKSHLRQCVKDSLNGDDTFDDKVDEICLLYTSPSPRDLSTSRMPSSA